MIFDCFRDRKVLITGHTGFKGSWLTLWLDRLGADITGIALDPRTPLDAYYAMNIASICNDLRQDITDFNGVLNIFSEIQPRIVFHLAAQPLVLESYENPLYTLNTNIIGTANILEACRLTPSIKVIVVVTSDKCYENRETLLGYSENDKLGGKDPYSVSKACAELIVHSYRESFFKGKRSCSLASVRAGNILGGGDWAENRIIPDCIKSLKEDKPIILRNPGAIRPWQHVLDPLGGYLILAAKMLDNPEKYNEPWNFGPGYKIKKNVEELAIEIIKLWGNGSYASANHQSKNQETGILNLDILKAKQKLKWKPILSFEESVKLAVDWYKSQMRNENMVKISLNQLEFFENLLTKKLS
jgi:CDP-glucose 4,6-dehydratase